MTRVGPTMGRPGGGFGDQVEVEHVCFECGGPLAPLAVPCRVCNGRGLLTDSELDIAMRRYNLEQQ